MRYTQEEFDHMLVKVYRVPPPKKVSDVYKEMFSHPDFSNAPFKQDEKDAIPAR